jgi:hypothetical protein
VTWLKVDDKLTTHPKWLPLSLEAKSLWFHAAVWCASHNNDGRLPDEAMMFIAFSATIHAPSLDAAQQQLVRARLWARVPKHRGGGFEIVNWLDYQPSKQQVQDKADADEVKAEMDRIHAWLHKKAPGKRVKKLIDARDGLWCRYCGSQTVITQGDRRGPHRRTYDLIDPAERWDMTASALPDDELRRIAELWAVACGWCNAIKSKRTPAEAGMTLLPPPILSRHNDLPRSAANRSATVPEVGTGLAEPVLVGTATGVGFGSILAAPRVSSARASVTYEPDAPPPPDDHHFTGDDQP